MGASKYPYVIKEVSNGNKDFKYTSRSKKRN